MPMQRPQRDEALLGLDGYEQMVNTFAQNAKAYWRLWGPLGEPMVRIVEAGAEQQRSYLSLSFNKRRSRNGRARPPLSVKSFEQNFLGLVKCWQEVCPFELET